MYSAFIIKLAIICYHFNNYKTELLVNINIYLIINLYKSSQLIKLLFIKLYN